MQIHKLSFGLALLGSSLVWLSSCGGSAHSPDEKYFLVSTNIKLSYWQTALAGLNRAKAEMRVKADMVGPDTYDPKAEQQAFRQAVAQNPMGILVSASESELLAPEIDSAMAKGIPVLTIDSDASNSKRLFFVGTDNYKAGTLSGELTAKLLKNKGSVVIFTMPEQANLKDRLHGFRDVAETHDEMKVTDVIDMKGQPEVAFDMAQTVLKSKNKVDAIVCLEAIACQEVADVVTREKMNGKVVIVAMDTDQKTLEWIQKGTIAATIAQKPFTMAFYGLKLLDDVHHHKPNPLVADWTQDSFSRFPTFVDTGASLIDKDNVNMFIQQRQSSTTQ